jgi:glycosyltransferase involved in cell wall biosynthesis
VKRLLYVANVRLPSERANAYQILAQVDALTAAGFEATILVPARRNPSAVRDDQIAKWYGLRADPRIERLRCIDWIDSVAPRFQRVPFVLQSLTFARSLASRLRAAPPSIVYTRDAWSLALSDPALHRRHRVFFEVHDLPEHPGRLRRFVAAAKRCAGVVTITRGLADDLAALGLPREATIVLPDAYDPARFAAPLEKAAARARIGANRDRPLAVYAGHLFPWKGGDVLVAAAAGADFDVLLLGGRDEDRARVADRIAALRAGNVTLRPPVAPREVPDYLAAADVLVLPNSGTTRISERYTSPLKLFEYLAAGRPIVASKLPSIEEILTDGVTARLVAPDDPAALRAGILEVLRDRDLARRLAEAGSAIARRYTFDARAEALSRFFAARAADASSGGSSG